MNELLWKSSVEDIKRGYAYQEDKEKYICLMCGESFEEGYIYQADDELMEAKKAIVKHIGKNHGSVFEYLINMDRRYTGLTDIQKELVESFYKGISDKEITKLHGNSAATIRTQRFALREKAKQAKIYLSIIELMNESMEVSGKNAENETKNQLIEIHSGATMIDDRYAITEEERENTLKIYFLPQENLKLKKFPAREKKKVIVLKKIAGAFIPKKRYTEQEVNDILKSIYDDFVTLRRYLIEYGFMERTKDCKEYWIKE
ncbi:DUF2087 domain-containing protein [Clostridium thermarum]|uniref:DUF2087 domain-containing protein n=1 Tax=Clostridium thermarum TaxID=1716543 RepID=UPI00111D3665|nr:DUF2087 domain-containing protein [Clostridium thermarum]